MSGYLTHDLARQRLESSFNLANLLRGRVRSEVREEGSVTIDNPPSPTQPTPDSPIEVITPEIVETPVGEIRPLHNGGRRPGDTALTEVERVTVGLLTNLVGAKAASEITGVSKGHAHQLGEGRSTSPTPGRDSTATEMKQQIESRLGQVKAKAIEKLLKTLDAVTDEGTALLSVKDAAEVSSKLASVIDRTTQKDRDGGNIAQVVIYAPRIRDESEYDVVTVAAGKGR